MRCGRCCTSFAVCVTAFDVKRITAATKIKPKDFLDLLPEPKERERTEPAIRIGDKYFLLVLKRSRKNVCYFYSESTKKSRLELYRTSDYFLGSVYDDINKGCIIYTDRPMLCRTYPYKSSKKQLIEMFSRACQKHWQPNNVDKKQYLKDCEKYKKEINAYADMVKEWNKKSGDFREFLRFICPCPNVLQHPCR
jgi:Fe-S-cluster containining protein